MLSTESSARSRIRPGASTPGWLPSEGDVPPELAIGNRKLTLSVAANYGGRWDVVQACRRIVETARQPMMNIRFTMGSGPQAR